MSYNIENIKMMIIKVLEKLMRPQEHKRYSLLW